MPFTHFIRKVQRNLCDEISLTRETAVMIDQFLSLILSQVVQTSVAIVNYANHKTLTDKVFLDSVSIMLQPGLTVCVQKVIQHSNISLILFHHRVIRKLVKAQLPIDFIVTKRYTQCMTLLLQYLCSEIVELTAIQTDKKEASLSTPDDLASAIQHDSELYALYQKFQMIILPNQKRLIRTVTIDPIVPIRSDALDLIELFARNS